MTQPRAVIPGSGRLTADERVLAARVQGFVEISADTLMIKLLAPGELDRYLRSEVTPGEWGMLPPFDFRVIGGVVARHQDTINLHTPSDFMRAFRVDYSASTFRPDQPVVHVMEFLAVHPNQYIIPFGAPTPGTQMIPRASTHEVRDAAYAMIDAAVAAGLNPNTYQMEIRPWPYTGTGVTADPALGVPERWRRYSAVPAGATIFQFDRAARKAPVAIYRGVVLGWERLR